MILSVAFTCTKTVLKKENPEGYFKRLVLCNLRLEVGRTNKYPYIIWDSKEWCKEYGVLHLGWREVNTWKDDIMLMDGDVCGNW